MAQHFLLSKYAKTLSLSQVFRVTDGEAESTFRNIRGGEGKVDGGYFGGYVKPTNQMVDRKDRRLARNQNRKRKVVVIIRERCGNLVPAVFGSESQAASFIKASIAKGTTVHADEASS